MVGFDLDPARGFDLRIPLICDADRRKVRIRCFCLVVARAWVRWAAAGVKVERPQR